MISVNMHEAKTRLSELVKAVEPVRYGITPMAFQGGLLLLMVALVLALPWLALVIWNWLRL